MSKSRNEVGHYQEKQDLAKKIERTEERKLNDIAKAAEKEDAGAGDEEKDKNAEKRAKNLVKMMKYN